MARTGVRVLRVYHDDGPASAYRVLVDGLWPRGIRKDALHIDEWAKDLAPTTALRRWYGHDPARFAEFSCRYQAELRSAPAADALARVSQAAGRQPLILLTATKDVAHSGAEVLRQLLSGPDSS
jgi:uncharacterized protein YeaO (DUF488 family)